jgi:dolichol-phosphate mannosyltransferase
MFKTVSNELYALIRIFIDKHMGRVIKFAFVGASGSVLNLCLTWILTEYVHLFYVLSAALAIEMSILWAFALNSKITFAYQFKKPGHLATALGKYHGVALGGLCINLTVLYTLTEFFGVFYLVSELAAIIVAFGFNYLMCVRFVWINNGTVA